MSFQLGQLPSGGAIDSTQGRRKQLDNWLETGQISQDYYESALEHEKLSDVDIVEHQKAKMRPLLSMGVGGGFGFGLALLAGAFVLWKIID